jgi:hypothetical protein
VGLRVAGVKPNRFRQRCHGLLGFSGSPPHLPQQGPRCGALSVGPDRGTQDGLGAAEITLLEALAPEGTVRIRRETARRAVTKSARTTAPPTRRAGLVADGSHVFDPMAGGSTV